MSVSSHLFYVAAKEIVLDTRDGGSAGVAPGGAITVFSAEVEGIASGFSRLSNTRARRVAGSAAGASWYETRGREGEVADLRSQPPNGEEFFSGTSLAERQAPALEQTCRHINISAGGGGVVPDARERTRWQRRQLP